MLENGTSKKVLKIKRMCFSSLEYEIKKQMYKSYGECTTDMAIFTLFVGIALIEAASHAFLRGYSEEQEIAPNKKIKTLKRIAYFCIHTDFFSVF